MTKVSNAIPAVPMLPFRCRGSYVFIGPSAILGRWHICK